MVVIEQNLVLTPPNSAGTFGRIDIDGDGNPDVTITVGTATAYDESGHNGILRLFGVNGAQVAYLPGAYPIAFQASDMVGSTLDFQGGVRTLAFSSGGWRGGRGGWFGGGDAYFGMRFPIGGIFYYGWVHAVWNADLNTLSVDRSGYNDSGAAAVVLPRAPEYPPNFQHRFGEETDLENGTIEVIWPVLAGKTYEVERSIDLHEWTSIHTVSAEADGELSYLDNEFAGMPKEQCFYRVGQHLGSPLLLLALGLRRREAGPAFGPAQDVGAHR
jgi:hypothetical protein